MLIENQLKKLGFGTAAVFLLVVASLLGAAQMYLLAVIVALVPVAGWISSWLMMRGISCSRSAPETADQYGRMQVALTLRNDSMLPKLYMRVSDRLPRHLRFAGNPPGDTGYINCLWPGAETKIRYLIEPMRRGAHQVGPLSIVASDLFGFTELRRTLGGVAEVLVYPEILPATGELLSGGSASGWRDDPKARRRGDGIDFTGVREYREGDDLRRINWKTTARTGSLAVTEFTQGFATDITIVLDTEASAYNISGVGDADSFEDGVKIATSLGAAGLDQGSSVRLYCGAQDAVMSAPMVDFASVGRLLDRLARVQPEGVTSVSEQISDAYQQIESSSIFVIVTPRSPDDAALRAEIERLWRYGGVAGIDVYWLDIESYRRAAEDRSLRGRRQAPSAAFAYAIRAEFGREFTVGPGTNLVALLGGAGIA